jgi:protein disulfide-isomerase
MLFFGICFFQLEGAESTQKITWTTSYEDAVSQAKASSKPLLIFFTGSDWCQYCKKLDKDVLTQPEFISETADKFIFLLADTPSNSSNSQLMAQNRQLQRKFDIRGLPTIVLFDAKQQRTIGSVGYTKNSPKAYADHLLKMVNDYSGYQQKMQKVEQGQLSLSGMELKQLYHQALQLKLENDARRIVRLGLDSDQKIFFQLERYRFLAQEGQGHDSEATAIRQQLLAADPENEHKIPYQIAVIDFEAYREDVESDNYSPEAAVRPLVTYIERFRLQDKENIWKLDMIIAQVFLDKNEPSEALKYAEASYQEAPATVQPEIALAIRSIRASLN